jgi:UMF1 family MFS transporter
MESSRKVIFSWCMYDWANSAFATTIMAAVLPPYFIEIAKSKLGGNIDIASAYWAYTVTIAMLTGAILSPILGAIADHSGARKRLMFFFAVTGSAASALLVMVTTGDWLLASLLYILGNISFTSSIVFNDSLLPYIAGDRIDTVSSQGYATGYLGGGILLVVNLAMIMKPDLFGIPDTGWGVRLSFVTVGVWWIIFTIPVMLNVPEPPVTILRGEYRNPVAAGFQRLAKTFSEIRKFGETFKMLIAFWLYNDGIGTIIVMATAFGKVIGIQETHLIAAIVMVQFLGIPFTLLFGRIARRFSPKTGIMISLFIYTGIAVGAYFIQNTVHFFILAFFVSMVQGGSQALSRSLYGSMIPKSKTAEFYGFYDVSSKVAGILGPFIYATVTQFTASSRNGIIAIVFFFLAGAIILSLVNHRRGIETAERVEREIQQAKAAMP